MLVVQTISSPKLFPHLNDLTLATSTTFQIAQFGTSQMFFLSFRPVHPGPRVICTHGCCGANTSINSSSSTNLPIVFRLRTEDLSQSLHGIRIFTPLEPLHASTRKRYQLSGFCCSARGHEASSDQHSCQQSLKHQSHTVYPRSGIHILMCDSPKSSVNVPAKEACQKTPDIGCRCWTGLRFADHWSGRLD
jgi:hypothetical protein